MPHLGSRISTTFSPIHRVVAGPAGPYMHLGVSFTPDFSLEWAAATIPDAPIMLASLKFRGCGSSLGVSIGDNLGTFGKQLFGSNTTDSTHSAEQPQGFIGPVIDNSAGNNGGGVFRAAVGDTNILTNGGFLTAYAPTSGHIKNMEYVEVTMAVRVDLGHNLKLGAMAIDGVQVGLFIEPGTWTSSPTISHSVGKFMVNIWEAAVGGPQAAANFDLARAYFTRLSSATGVLDPTPSVGFDSSFLQKVYKLGVGTVDFGADGSLLGVSTPNSGNAPDIFLEVRPGGVATDILTNRGHAGNPTASAYSGTTSTAFKAPYLASIHPDETGEQPYLAWLPVDANVALSDTGSYSAAISAGQEIRVGDLMCVAFCSGGAGTRATLACASTNGGTWTKLAGITSDSADFSIWTHTATSSDITANGVEWNSSTRPTLSWTAGGGFGAGSSNATMTCWVIRRPSGNTVSATAVTQGRASGSVPFTGGSITPGASPGLLVDYLKAYGWQYEPLLTPDATMIPRFKNREGLGGCYPQMYERRVTGTSSISSRSYTLANTTGNVGSSISVVYS